MHDALENVAAFVGFDFATLGHAMRVCRSWRDAFKPAIASLPTRLADAISELQDGELLRRPVRYRERRRALLLCNARDLFAVASMPSPPAVVAEVTFAVLALTYQGAERWVRGGSAEELWARYRGVFEGPRALTAPTFRALLSRLDARSVTPARLALARHIRDDPSFLAPEVLALPSDFYIVLVRWVLAVIAEAEFFAAEAEAAQADTELRRLRGIASAVDRGKAYVASHPHACEACGERFGRASQLAQHRRLCTRK